MIPIKNKDICKSTEIYILQQCNCLTVTSHGLSKTLADHFDHGDAYKDRRRVGRRNLAIPEDRSVPGTVTILDGDSGPSIICVYGQYRPGKTNSRYSYPTEYPDTLSDRLKYFEECLDGLIEFFGEETSECPTIAVPFNIGCGLAGGRWDRYLALLNTFHLQLQEKGGGLVFYKI